MSFFGEQQALNAVRIRRLMVWMRRYVDNRTLPGLVLWALLAISMSMSLLLSLTIFSEHFILYLVLTTTVSLLCWVTMMWLCWPKHGENVIMRFGRFLYRKDGELHPTSQSKQRKLCLNIIAGIGPLILWMAMSLAFHWCRSYFGETPPELIQPISALFIVPYVILLAHFKNQVDISWMNIFVLLYTTYGILILVGVPLYFTDELLAGLLNSSLPLLASILLSLLIGHAINRVAMRRIRELSGTILAGGSEA